MIFFKKLVNFGTFWTSKMGEKVKCLMKCVRIAPNFEILIPIDAPQVWDLKNAGFGMFFSNLLGVKKHFAFFGSFLAPRIPRLGPY